MEQPASSPAVSSLLITGHMDTCTAINVTRAAIRAARQAGKRIGLVPTMGALHEGHLSLVRIAKAQSDFVVVSLFVNPLQFGPKEDLAKYPRSFERDCEMLTREDTDLLFAPAVTEMYPTPAVTYVNVEGLSERLDGPSRPGHFRGVTTVVSKLFHIVEPDIAVFGQKDAAQVAIIRRMVRDLNMPVAIVVAPVIREPDGLAMSSRNAYLDPQQRQQALILSRSLRAVQERFKKGERCAERLIAAGLDTLQQEPAARLDYLSVVDPESLEPITNVASRALVAVAAYVGSTRLIDNVVLD
ncbi:MAG TPA: pantoate--beta-alanine ligase [Terriglobales bacterium]|nr:pantoate--beta-alanine ligase [Terriglobales bacterium]